MFVTQRSPTVARAARSRPSVQPAPAGPLPQATPAPPAQRPAHDALGGLLARSVLQRVVVDPAVLTRNNIARSQNLVRNLRPTEEALSGILDGYTAHFHANNYSQASTSAEYRNLTSFTGTFTRRGTTQKHHVTFNERPDTGLWRVQRAATDDWEREAEEMTWYRLECVLPARVAPASASSTPAPAPAPVAVATS